MKKLLKYLKLFWAINVFVFGIVISSCICLNSEPTSMVCESAPSIPEQPAETLLTRDAPISSPTNENAIDEPPKPTQTLIFGEIEEENDDNTVLPLEFEWTDLILYETDFPGGLFAFSLTSLERYKVLDGRPVFLSSDHNSVIFYSTNTQIEFVDLATGVQSSWNIPPQCLGRISKFPKNNWIAISCDHNIWVIHLGVGSEYLEINSGDLDFRFPSVSSTGEYVVSWGHSQALVPDSASGMYITKLSCHGELINCDIYQEGPFFPTQSSGFAAWSNNGRFLAISLVQSDGSIKIFDVEKKIILDELKTNSREIGGIAWSPNDQELAFSTEDGLYVINIESQEIVKLLEVERPNDTFVRGWISNQE